MVGNGFEPRVNLDNTTQSLEQATAPEQAFDPPMRFSGHIAAPREVDRVRVKTKAKQNYRAQICVAQARIQT